MHQVDCRPRPLHSPRSPRTQHGFKHSIWAVFVLSLFVLSCGSVDVAPLGADHKEFQAEDEKKLREAAAELAKAIERAGLFYQDAALENYLNEVARKLWASTGLSIESAARVKVIKHPFVNAFAAPDGQIYFHSGLLARLENEAQFAVILGHELKHYIQRHTLKEKRLAD